MSGPTISRSEAAERGELERLEMPVLLLLGTRDPLVGDGSRAAERAAAMPDLRVETLESSHLVAVERASEVNELLVGFLDDRDDAAGAT